IHIAVDIHSRDIRAVEITEERVHDSKAVKELISQVDEPIERVIGDGAYDTKEVYRVVKEHNPCAKVIVPPRRSGKIIQHGNSSGDRHRRGEH
ncbi:MAG: transposase, partial [Aquificaceae bacterium]